MMKVHICLIWTIVSMNYLTFVTTSIISGIPNSPESIQTSLVTSSEIVVTWDLPLGPAKVDHYIASIQAKGRIMSEKQTSFTNYTFSNLQPATNYHIDIFAAQRGNGEELISESAELNITTLETKPGKPQNLKIILLSYDKVIVKWSKPCGKRVDHYRVLCKSKIEILYDGEAFDRNFTFHNLEPNEEYEIGVKAVIQRGGESILSQPVTINVTTLEKSKEGLEKPENLQMMFITTNKIKISWFKPYRTILIDHYVINYYHKNDLIAQKKTNARNFVVRKLKSSKEYYIIFPTAIRRENDELLSESASVTIKTF